LNAEDAEDAEALSGSWLIGRGACSRPVRPRSGPG